MKILRLTFIVLIFIWITLRCQSKETPLTSTTSTPAVPTHQQNLEKKEPQTTKAPLKCQKTMRETLLNRIIQEHSHIPYSNTNLADCSGIFHRVLKSIKEACPKMTTKVPSLQYRSSRDIGRWYHEQGVFTRINNPIEQAKLIKVGAVMFYSKQAPSYYKTTKELWQHDGIRHVGIVVAVKKNPINDEIISYSLFHGRYPGKPSGITSGSNYMHLRTPTRDTYPPFGNGQDAWVGVSSIITD